MVEALKIPAHQPTSVGAMLKEEFLEPLGIPRVNWQKRWA